MASILITKGTKRTRIDEASKISGFKRGSLNENILWIGGKGGEEVKKERSISIRAVREAERFLHKKTKKGFTKYVVIEEASKLSLPAQNALLKTLEEPPNNSTIILLCRDKDLLLKTIVSRCAIKRAKRAGERQKKGNLPENISFNPKYMFDYIAKNPSIYKDKDSALEFLEECEEVLKNKLRNSIDENSFEDIEKNKNLIKSIFRHKPTIINTNASLRLVLENIFLNF